MPEHGTNATRPHAFLRIGLRQRDGAGRVVATSVPPHLDRLYGNRAAWDFGREGGCGGDPVFLRVALADHFLTDHPTGEIHWQGTLQRDTVHNGNHWIVEVRAVVTAGNDPAERIWVSPRCGIKHVDTRDGEITVDAWSHLATLSAAQPAADVPIGPVAGPEHNGGFPPHIHQGADLRSAAEDIEWWARRDGRIPERGDTVDEFIAFVLARA